MRNGLVRKLGISVTLVAFLFTTSGCFGGFNLTRNVWQFNRDVSPNKWVQELVFLGLVIVPVYAIASIIDAIFINSIEFWTGENPVTVSTEPETRVVERGDTRLVQTMTATPSEKVMVVEEYHKGDLVKTVTTRYEKGASSVQTEVRHADGRVETHVTTLEADGSATVVSTDDEGRINTRSVAAAEVEQLGERARVLAATGGTTQVASAAVRSW